LIKCPITVGRAEEYSIVREVDLSVQFRVLSQGRARCDAATEALGPFRSSQYSKRLSLAVTLAVGARRRISSSRGTVVADALWGLGYAV
jgi:hypothetical protein